MPSRGRWSQRQKRTGEWGREASSDDFSANKDPLRTVHVLISNSFHPTSGIPDQLPRDGIKISAVNVQKHGHGNYTQTPGVPGQPGTDTHLHGHPTRHTALHIQSNTDMASPATHAPDNFSTSPSETLNTSGPPPGGIKSNMGIEADHTKIKSPDVLQSKPTEPTRKGTMQIQEMASVAMRCLLADIDYQARQKLDKQELEVLLAMADEMGSGLATEQTIPDLVASVEIWKDSLEKKRGRMITFPWHGKTMNVTKLLDDTVGWIRRFREIGDVVVQCDPVHLGLPWASIKFLTQVFPPTLFFDSDFANIRAKY